MLFNTHIWLVVICALVTISNAKSVLKEQESEIGKVKDTKLMNNLKNYFAALSKLIDQLEYTRKKLNKLRSMDVNAADVEFEQLDKQLDLIIKPQKATVAAVAEKLKMYLAHKGDEQKSALKAAIKGPAVSPETESARIWIAQVVDAKLHKFGEPKSCETYEPDLMA